VLFLFCFLFCFFFSIAPLARFVVAFFGNFPTLPLAKRLVMKTGELQRTVYRNRGPAYSKQDGDL